MTRLQASKLAATAVMGCLSILFLTPLLWMLSTAAKLEKDVFAFPIEWIPKHWHAVENFKTVWLDQVPFGLYYLNSIKIAVIVTATTLLFTSMAGYAFARLQFPWKSTVFVLLLSFYLIPDQSTLVPRYILIKWLGLYDTHASLILMGSFNIPLTFLMRQFMVGISHEYFEAARMDGAGFFRIYWQVMLPLARPILATVAILKFLWNWNDFQGPLIFLLDTKRYTIPLGVQSFNGMYSSSYAAIMMASVSAIVPLIVLFIILQKHVIKGIAAGGVKG